MHTLAESGNSSNVPAFLVKLWRLVDDKTSDDLIKWNSSGLSFTIRDQARFARELLPLYYKHNNMASFVRQLNMYGFHKVVSVDSGALKADKEEMEFAHTYFLRGHDYLLEHIKRKIPTSKQEEGKVKPEMMSKVLLDVRSMKGKQDTLDTRLSSLKRENEALWQEVSSLRQKHLKQQQIVNKLIQFLITVVQPNGRAGLGPKRRHPLMLDEVAHSVKEAELNARNDEKGPRNGSSSTNRHKDMNFSDAPTLPSQTPGGPIIHDVTDLIDDPGNDGVVEVPIDDEDSYMTGRPIVTEAQETNESSTSHISNVTGKQSGKEDLDTHLDAIQMDLENLREFLSLQTESVDTSALLGVCEIMDLSAGSPPVWQERNNFGYKNSFDYNHSQQEHPNSSKKAYGPMEPNLPGTLLSAVQEMPSASQSENLNPAIGTEMMSYNPSFFELAADDSHYLGSVGGNFSAAGGSNIDLDSTGDDFLGLHDSSDIEEPAIKKWKR